MFLGKVVGKVVSTQKDEKLIGTKLLIVQQIDNEKNTIGNSIVAIDTVGAGINEIVLVVNGSTARYIYENNIIPTDAAIIGIVDSIETDT